MAVKKSKGTLTHKEVVKYRLYGLAIIILTLFVSAFAFLIFQERQQLDNAARTGRLVIEEHR